MKIIAIIPARYQSSRFPGKPLADICGKPMIWWVYNQTKKVDEIDSVYIATDDERIEKKCKELDINVVMTSNNHNTSTERVYEVAKKVKADYYIVINGDEPLINPKVISQIIPKDKTDEFYVSNIMTNIKDPVQVVDFTNIKVVTDANSNAMYFSRSPIPYPKGSMVYKYYKHVGILLYSFKALEFFSQTEKGPIEKIEDVNEIRFIENNKKIKMVKIEDIESLSVDTPKDLDKVRLIMESRLNNDK